MKSIPKKKIAFIAIALCFVFLLSFAVLAFIKGRKLTDTESIALHDYSDSLINYFENFEDSEEYEATLYQKELAFTLDYFYYEDSKESITTEELTNFLKDNFNTELNMETIEEDFTNLLIANKCAYYDSEEAIIKITPPSPTKKERARIPITKYLEKSIKKKGNSFEVSYEKYVIESAYDALNCLSRQENPEETEGSEEQSSEVSQSENTAKMMSYLKTESKINTAQDALTPECTKELSESKSTITIVYKTQNSKLFIEKIEHWKA